jgi:hypothetical protein
MNYRIDKEGLLERISAWDGFLKKKVHLIACGGTALTLLGVKSSTKDIDLIVPDLEEYEYLISILKQLGYKPKSGWGWGRDDGFIFDLFRGKFVHTTELLESPLKEGNNILIKQFERIYLGVLNYYDLIISKLFRATAVDIEDCIALIKNKRKQIDIRKLKSRFIETASFDTSEERLNKNFEHFLKILRKEGLLDEK